MGSLPLTISNGRNLMSLVLCPDTLKCSAIALEIFPVFTSLLWLLNLIAAVPMVLPVYWSEPGADDD